jgi:hypothetical protein
MEAVKKSLNAVSTSKKKPARASVATPAKCKRVVIIGQANVRGQFTSLADGDENSLQRD